MPVQGKRLHDGTAPGLSVYLSPLPLVVERDAAFVALRLMVKRLNTLPSVMEALPCAALLREDIRRRFNFRKNFTIAFSKKKVPRNESSMHNLKDDVIKWWKGPGQPRCF